VDQEGDHCVVLAQGELSLRTAPLLRRALLKALHDQSRVVVDVSRLRLLSPEVAALFPAVHAAGGGWPWVKMVLCGADSNTMWTLRRSFRDYVAAYPTLTEAVARLDERPRRIRRSRHLDCTPDAPAQCRAFVTETCANLGVPEDQAESIRLAASELVSNSVEHARTSAEVTLNLDDRGLRISVRDYSATPPVLRPFDVTSSRGRGMPLVVGLADRWGVIPHGDGKTVWLVFERSL
jgi:anti-sigma regulatory factor (Ser/Thr protein kinase)